MTTRKSFQSMPGKLGALAQHIAIIQRGICLAGEKIDAAALRDDANTLRELAAILDKCATVSAAIPRNPVRAVLDENGYAVQG